MAAEYDRLIGLRVYVLDNSGSTQAFDGKYLDPEANGGSMRMVPCTRWEEIRRMAMQQAEMNARVGTPCQFVLLNPPAPRGFAAFREGVDIATVDAAPGSPQVAEQLQALQNMLRNTRPEGATPLGQRLQEVHHRLLHGFMQQSAQGLRCVVIIATDGLPTCIGSGIPSDEARREVVTMLRRLTAQLRAFVVVRLTTDEDSVIEYYNRIDEEVELPLEVLDDFTAEAAELRDQGNGWLTYSPALHMLREGGTFVNVLDIMDERRLKPQEVQAFVGQYLQRSADDTAFPSNPNDFLQAVKWRLRETPAVYDPLQGCMAACIDQSKLRRALGMGLLSHVLGQCVPLSASRHNHAPVVRA